MGYYLGLIGLIGLVSSLVALVFSKTRKKGTRSSKIGLIVSALLFVLGIIFAFTLPEDPPFVSAGLGGFLMLLGALTGIGVPVAIIILFAKKRRELIPKAFLAIPACLILMVSGGFFSPKPEIIPKEAVPTIAESSSAASVPQETEGLPGSSVPNNEEVPPSVPDEKPISSSEPSSGTPLSSSSKDTSSQEASSLPEKSSSATSSASSAASSREASSTSSSNAEKASSSSSGSSSSKSQSSSTAHSSSEASSQTSSSTAQSSSDASSKLSDEKNIPINCPYEIKSVEDTSISNAIRKSLNIVISDEDADALTQNSFESLCRTIVKEYTESTPVNALTLYFFDNSTQYRIGKGYTIGMCTYYPEGEIAKALEIKTGDYSTFKFSYTFDGPSADLRSEAQSYGDTVKSIEEIETLVSSCIPERYKQKRGSTNDVEEVGEGLYQAYLKIDVQSANLEESKLIVNDIFKEILKKTPGVKFDFIHFEVRSKSSDGFDGCLINAYPSGDPFQLIMDGVFSTYTLD